MIALASAGCDVEFRHPLSDESTSILDERLIGDWSTGDGEIWRVTKRTGCKNSLELQIVGSPDPPPPPHGIIYTTVVGPHRFLSLRDPVEDADGRVSSIYRYEYADEHTVTFFGQDLDAFRAAIAAKELRGEIRIKKCECSPPLDSPVPSPDTQAITETVENEIVTVTEPAEALTRYLAKNGLRCFPDKKRNRLTFRRVKPKSEGASEHNRVSAS
jgi:hypothetical protein